MPPGYFSVTKISPHFFSWSLHPSQSPFHGDGHLLDYYDSLSSQDHFHVPYLCWSLTEDVPPLILPLPHLRLAVLHLVQVDLEHWLSLLLLLVKLLDLQLFLSVVLEVEGPPFLTTAFVGKVGQRVVAKVFVALWEEMFLGHCFW